MSRYVSHVTSVAVALTVLCVGSVPISVAAADHARPDGQRPARTRAATPIASTDPRPNIVVFYIDDVAPHDGRLWDSPQRTPTLHDRFIANGISFSNAIGEAPLCCPGRANVLTGLHTHNNGVPSNEGLLLDPSVHIGSELRAAGYTTMFIGKYLNGLHHFVERHWRRHGAGWDHLDAIDWPNGRFLDYVVHTKEGNVAYPHTHSTQMVAERAVARIQEAPLDRPVFALLSIYNMHGPNTPMREFAGSSLCADMPP
jgi:arylsulfatase A-like enzyme